VSKLELLKDRVAIYCLHTGETRESIAKRLGVSTVTLRSKLNGETEFKLSEAEALASILGCSVDELKKEFTCS
jgi:transcriptional regulator with XRE-family HTH domain